MDLVVIHKVIHSSDVADVAGKMTKVSNVAKSLLLSLVTGFCHKPQGLLSNVYT